MKHSAIALAAVLLGGSDMPSAPAQDILAQVGDLGILAIRYSDSAATLAVVGPDKVEFFPVGPGSQGVYGLSFALPEVSCVAIRFTADKGLLAVGHGNKIELIPVGPLSKGIHGLRK